MYIEHVSIKKFFHPTKAWFQALPRLKLSKSFKYSNVSSQFDVREGEKFLHNYYSRPPFIKFWLSGKFVRSCGWISVISADLGHSYSAKTTKNGY